MTTPVKKVVPGHYVCDFPFADQLQDAETVNFVESIWYTRTWPMMQIVVQHGEKWSFAAHVTIDNVETPAQLQFPNPNDRLIELMRGDPEVCPKGLDDAPVVTFLSFGQQYDKVTLVVCMPPNKTLRVYEQATSTYNSITYRAIVLNP